jgi:peptide/nickel transport system substrate-binding protein
MRLMVKKIRRRAMTLYIFIVTIVIIAGCSDSNSGGDKTLRVLRLSSGRVKTLDPALASDLSSRNMVAAFYDTLLQYDYTARPYKLMPSMLASMPVADPTMKSYTFTLRDDLYFQVDKCFGETSLAARKIGSRDVAYSFLRIADGRLHSPVFWMFRGKIVGMDKFRAATLKCSESNNSLYAKGIPGIEIIDKRTLIIHLKQPEPRFLYALAIPYASIVSRQAVEFYGDAFAEHPVGSGPFWLTEWIRDYRITMERNPNYRYETFATAENPADRQRRLPLLDKVVCNIIKQPLSAWLMFLQGELDMSALDKDNLDAVIGDDRKLIGALAKRGIKLFQTPEFEVRYIGFSFSDPILGENLNLRKAISLAYNMNTRIKYFNYQIIPAHGPIPPGVPGYDSDLNNPYAKFNLELARDYMTKAGYSNGLDPATGKALELTFDQSGSSGAHRQLAEMMVFDMKKIGIKIKPVLNNKPRFFQKVRQGKMQLFRLSWIGDYPDAENFLQLFYSKNAGSCNRADYRNRKFDKMFETIMPMQDSDLRTKKYQQMASYLTKQCPWIFESFPVSYQLLHSWLQNYHPHDFAFSRWKYLSLNPAERQVSIKKYTPLDMGELRK